jgi:hypothetical protein
MATAVSANVERHASALSVALEFYPQMAIQIIHKCSPNMVFTLLVDEQGRCGYFSFFQYHLLG